MTTSKQRINLSCAIIVYFNSINNISQGMFGVYECSCRVERANESCTAARKGTEDAAAGNRRAAGEAAR